MATDFDVVVLGGGSAGGHVATELAERNQRVAVVERDLVGGECAYWACIPSKTLLRATEVVHAARQTRAATAEVDVAAAFAWRDFMVSGFSDAGQEKRLRDNDVELVRGAGRISGSGTVEVGGRRWTAEHIVLATGSSPHMPSIDGLEGLEGIWGSREATAMTEVPECLIVLGAGPVGVEMAQVVRRLGGDVSLVSRGDRVLMGEPPHLGHALAEALRQDGIQVVTGRSAASIRKDGDTYVLVLDNGQRLVGDRVLLATGRRPNVRGIGLEEVGVKPNPRGIEVDARLRAADGVWAVGDVTGIWPLTHVGKYQGDVLAANIAGTPTEASYEAVPRVTFTDPAAAAVGAVDATFEVSVPVNGGAKLATYTREYAAFNGFLTLLSDGERLVGAYALGPEAGEWLQQATLAIRARVPIAVLSDTIQPFPTFSELFVAALKELRYHIGCGSR